MSEITSRQFLTIMYNQLSSLKKEDEKYFQEALLCIDLGLNPKDLRLDEQIALDYTSHFVDEKKNFEKKNFHFLDTDIVDTYKNAKSNPSLQAEFIRESNNIENRENEMFKENDYDRGER